MFLLGIFMGALDHGIVGPALSSIIQFYNIEASWGVWSFTIYTLFFAVSIPLMGKFSDRIGRKHIYAIGITLFSIGSLLAALAPNFILFLIGRAVQAIGTGGIFPITAAQIAATYPPEKRGKALGYIGVVFGIGSILGPIVGGFILKYLTWQWIFLINIPVSVAILFLLLGVKQSQELTKKPIDYRGIVLLTLTILTVMLSITLKSPVLIMIGLLWCYLLVKAEKKAKDPVVNIRYFTKRNTLSLLLLSLTSGFIMASTINLLPLFGETVLGLSKAESGIGVTPLAISSMIASLIGGLLVDKIGANKVLLGGFSFTLLGAVALALFVNYISAFVVTITVMGFGIGIIIGAPLNVMMMKNVSVQETGSAIGFLSLLRSLGSTLGPTMAGIMLTVFPDKFTYIYLISAALSILSVMVVFSFTTTRKQTQR
nr:MFS transporter [Ectobacillus antri]